MATTAEATPGELDEHPGVCAAEVLARVVDAEAVERRAGVEKLELALQWCLLHPATGTEDTAVWGHAGLPGWGEWDETLGGEGTPLVAAFAPEPFAAALGVSTFTGMGLLADVLDLAYRLPQTWARVRRLEVAPWKARRLAQATHRLSREAAAYVDRHLAARVDSCGVVLIDRTVAHAAARFDPDTQATAEQAERAGWDVELTHRTTDGRWAGTSHLHATGDTLAFTRLYDLVCDHAAHLARLGDTDPLGARKAKALGIIADQQTHLDVSGAGAAETPAVRRPSLTKTRLYLHLHLTDLHASLEGAAAVGEVEKLGPATTTKIKDWLGQSRVTIVPVLHLDRHHADDTIDAVDVHDPPDRMRETITLTDPHCVFPWCRVDARACDLDHITPYLPIDQGGPPGQTTPANLAPLCRRHHNAKTTGRWRYQRHRDGTYTWHGPHHTSYLVTPLGTTSLTDA